MKSTIKLRSYIVLTSFVTMLVVLSIVFFALIQVSRSIISSDVNQHVQDMHETKFSGMSFVLDEINLLYSRIVLDASMSEVFNEENETQKQQTFERIIERAVIDETLFLNIFLLDDEILLEKEEVNVVPDDSLIDETFNTNALLTFGDVIPYNDTYGIWVGKKLRNLPNVLENSAMFFLVSEKTLEAFVTTDDTSQDTYLLDGDGSVIITDDDALLGAKMVYAFDTRTKSVSTKDTLYTFSTSKDLQTRYNITWTLVTEIPNAYVFRELNQLTVYLVLIAVLAVLISLPISLYIANKIRKPMESMLTHVETFVSNHQVPSDMNQTYGIEEINQLKSSYDDMIVQIMSLLDAKSKDEALKRELELYALQMQINPHFLYNTLDAIAWIAKIKDQKEIEELVLNLAEFFRISLHKGDKFITVEEELTLIKKYIHILSVRFPNTFDVIYDVDPTILEKPILKLIIQPVVENALKHGLQYSKNGVLKIRGVIKDGFLVFEIHDNGKGFDVSKVEKKRKTNTLSGYGLNNIKDRILLEYGPESTLFMSSKIGVGTTVTLKLALMDHDQ